MVGVLDAVIICYTGVNGVSDVVTDYDTLV